VSAGFSPRGRSVQQIEPFRNLAGLAARYNWLTEVGIVAAFRLEPVSQ